MSEASFDTPRPVQLEVKVPSVELDVATVADGESTVTLEGPQQLIDATKVELIGDRLAIGPERKTLGRLFGRFDGPLHVRVRVPHHSRVQLVTAAGEATLDGKFAELETQSASTAIRVSGEIDGDANVRSVSGEVRLSRVAGELTAQTVSGSVSAESVDGSVSAKSVSGALRLGSLRQGNVDVQSVSGDVELGIAPDTSIDVEAGSANGKLSSEIPLSATPGKEDGPVVVIRGNTVSGAFRIFRAA